MFIPPFDSPSNTHTKADLLKAPANNENKARDNTQPARLYKSTPRAFLKDLLTDEDNQNRKNQPRLVNNGKSFFLVSEVNRQRGQERPETHPNVRLPFPAPIK